MTMVLSEKDLEIIKIVKTMHPNREHYLIENMYSLYPTMSEKDKRRNLNIINHFFQNRINILSSIIATRHELFHEGIANFDYIGEYLIVGMSVCKVDDTLKPIDEYLKDIKNSDIYKKDCNHDS